MECRWTSIHRGYRGACKEILMSFIGYLVVVPKCAWCNTHKHMKQHVAWFEYKGKKHYGCYWMCDKCNANNGVGHYG